MIGHLWRSHRWLLLGFLAATALALFFTARAVVSTLYWTDHRDETIAGWMTPRYVAMSWDVPPEVVSAALGIAQDGTGRRMTLSQIASDRGQSAEALADDLRKAIEAHRAGR